MIQLSIDYGKIGSIPLILFGVYWASATGFMGGILYRGFTLTKQSIEWCFFFDFPLILIVVGVWLSRYKLFLYLGRIGTIIWLLPFGFYSVMVLGEFEHTDPIIWIEYPVLFLSTILVILSLWKPKKKRMEHEDNLH